MRAAYAALPLPPGATASPCGICRQLLAEFGPDVLVFAASSLGDSVYVARLGDLLPLSFGPRNLADAGSQAAIE